VGSGDFGYMVTGVGDDDLGFPVTFHPPVRQGVPGDHEQAVGFTVYPVVGVRCDGGGRAEFRFSAACAEERGGCRFGVIRCRVRERTRWTGRFGVGIR